MPYTYMYSLLKILLDYWDYSTKIGRARSKHLRFMPYSYLYVYVCVFPAKDCFEPW